MSWLRVPAFVYHKIFCREAIAKRALLEWNFNLELAQPQKYIT